MMQWLLFIPVILGIIAVLQGALNKTIAVEWGLVFAITLNCVIVFVSGVVFFVLVRLVPDWFPSSVHLKVGPRLPWWVILPGLFGFCLVGGVPIAIGRLGAFVTFLTLIASQIVASLAWDIWVERIPLSPLRIVGAILVLSGAVLVAVRR